MNVEISLEEKQDYSKLVSSLKLDIPKEILNKKKEAFEAFFDLDVETDPLYAKYVDEDTFSIGKELTLESSPLELSTELLDKINSLNAVIVRINGRLVFSKFPRSWTEKGVLLLDNHKEILSLGKKGTTLFDEGLKEAKKNKFAALNYALSFHPLTIIIPSRTELEEILYVIDLDFPEMGTKHVFSQTFIFIGEQSSIKLVREFHSVPFKRGEKRFWNDFYLIKLEESASLKTGILNVLSENTLFTGQIVLRSGKNSAVEWLSTQIGSKAMFLKNYFYLDHEGAELTNYECLFGDNEQEMIIVTKLQHLAPHTIGHTYNRTVVKDQASASSIGIASVHRQAPYSDSNLIESSLIVGDEASANSFPFLEIDTAEVRAGHSASTSKLDEDLVFYVMSRGLPKEDTEQLLIRGYLAPIIQKHSVEEIKFLANKLVQNKWDDNLEEIVSLISINKEEI